MRTMRKHFSRVNERRESASAHGYSTCDVHTFKRGQMQTKGKEWFGQFGHQCLITFHIRTHDEIYSFLPTVYNKMCFTNGHETLVYLEF